MRILAVDTAIGECSVALFQGEQLLLYLEEKEIHKQSERLIPMIEQSLAELQWEYKDLDCLAVSIGPGSFTGIRIGVAAVNAIAMAAYKEIVGVTCFEAMAEFAMQAVCVTIDAGRKQSYVQKFEYGVATAIPKLIDDKALKRYAGNYRVIGNKFADEIVMPNAKLVGKAALRKLSHDGSLHKQVTPFYIREPDAKIPTAKISN